MPFCRKCKTEKSLDEMVKNKNRANGHECSICQACKQKQNKQYYAANAERIRKQKMEYYQRVTNGMRVNRKIKPMTDEQRQMFLDRGYTKETIELLGR